MILRNQRTMLSPLLWEKQRKETLEDRLVAVAPGVYG